MRRRDNSLRRISEVHPSYDALQYPLILWRGQDTYHIDMRQIDPDTGEQTRKRLSVDEYYSYQFMIRNPGHDFLLKCGPLMNQYAVDMYAKIEARRLNYFRFHQGEIRADAYVFLRDAMRQDGDAQNVGRRIILPSTFTGGPRYLHEYAQDSLTYVRHFGRPDLFITFTCNPKWPEIIELLGEQKVDHCHI